MISCMDPIFVTSTGVPHAMASTNTIGNPSYHCDGKTRNCRVPGRKRRGLWLREGDAIIIEPWEFDDEKGDVLFKYTDNQVRKLKEMGKLVIDEGEF